jgi:hypothetical protein
MFTLNVYDFRVVVYMLHRYYVAIKQADGIDKANNWVKCAWVYILNRGFTESPYQPSCTIIADDSGVYWRRAYLSERGFPHYKGNRSSKDDDWYQVEKIAKSYIADSNFIYLAFPGWEADDVAAAICQTVNGKYKIHLNTIDSDWMGLINGEITWCNLAHYEPRMRNLANYKVWTDKKKFKTKITKPADIWRCKQIEGDRSDNLIPGSPMEVIDLLNPPKEYNLLNHEVYAKSFELLKEQLIPNSNVKHLFKAQNWIIKNGFNLPGCGAQTFIVDEAESKKKNTT